MDRRRLEAFSDGVFAAYGVSFLAIGITWVNHHALFRNFADVNQTMLFLNLLMLFFVVTIPFATATVAAYPRSGRGGRLARGSGSLSATSPTQRRSASPTSARRPRWS